MVDIVHQVLVQKQYPAMVAREFRITPATVYRHAAAVQKRPSLLAEMLSKHRVAMENRHAIADLVQAKVDQHEVLDSVAKVTADVNSAADAQHSPRLV